MKLSAIDTLVSVFGLSPFERSVLLLCAGMELDSRFAALCASAQSEPRPCPTFSLALAALAEADWQALAPSAPLRYWRMIEVGAGNALTTSPLRIDERILHFLLGVDALDERISGLLEPDSWQPSGVGLSGEQSAIAHAMVEAWSAPAARLPLLQFCGRGAAAKRETVRAACERVGLDLAVISANSLPRSVSDLRTLARIWQREAVLSGRGLMVECDDVAEGRTDTDQSSRPDGDLTVQRAVICFVAELESPVVVSARQRFSVDVRPAIAFELGKPHPGAQREAWREELGPAYPLLEEQVDRLVSQFDLSPSGVRAACMALPHAPDAASDTPEAVGSRLWDICRLHARPRLDDLAQRIASAAFWDDLVLPLPQRQALREIAIHVRNRNQVYERWGFGGSTSRGLGIAALFAGPSGTGKTLAAEVIANELRLDLYRIDLSSVVSKYIGETEKNLRRVFDAAEAGGAVLLFDEADALFGKRSEVKDSHDRHANIEVSYLLQRMEAYRGLAILTTNLKESLDTAFLRRLRFVVQFPMPDAPERAEIWRRMFPSAAPTSGIDFDKLARLAMTGGNIRNVVLSAAFLAAEDRSPILMAHLLRAARGEYAKSEKHLLESETRGWV
jgi:hypothetical protein